MNLIARWKHRGIEITFREDVGSFHATIDGIATTRDSLRAMRYAIDNYLAKRVKPFFALDAYDGFGYVKRVRVIGLRRIGGRINFVIKGGRMRSTLYPNTPETRAALKEVHRLDMQRDRIRSKVKPVSALATLALTGEAAGK